MKVLTLALLLLPSLAVAGPDFVAPPAPTRSLAASNATERIEPSELVTFAFDSDALDPLAIIQLDQIAHWMKHHPGQHLVLEGHTDIIGTADYNLDLGRRRAIAVRDHLRSWGISGDRVLVAVFGEHGAHRTVDESDRHVLVFASQRPMGELIAMMMDTTRAQSVVWTDHGTRLEEARTVEASR